MAEKRQKKQAVKAFEKETFSKDKEMTGVKHIEHRQDNTFLWKTSLVPARSL